MKLKLDTKLHVWIDQKLISCFKIQFSLSWTTNFIDKLSVISTMNTYMRRKRWCWRKTFSSSYNNTFWHTWRSVIKNFYSDTGKEEMRFIAPVCNFIFFLPFLPELLPLIYGTLKPIILKLEHTLCSILFFSCVCNSLPLLLFYRCCLSGILRGILNIL